ERAERDRQMRRRAGVFRAPVEGVSHRGFRVKEGLRIEAERLGILLILRTANLVPPCLEQVAGDVQGRQVSETLPLVLEAGESRAISPPSVVLFRAPVLLDPGEEEGEQPPHS